MSPETSTAQPAREGPRRLFERLMRDRRGLAAIEFALTVPALILLFVGVAGLGLAATTYRKVNAIAFEVANLAAEQSSLTGAEITDIFTVGTLLLPAPLQGNLSMRLMSVKPTMTGANVTGAFVAWCVSNAPQGTLLTCPANNSAIPNFPLTMLPSAQSSVVQSDVRDNFAPPSGTVLPNGIALASTAYVNPRQSTTITYTP